MTSELKKAQSHEKETVQELNSLQKRIDAKVAECDSLKFRIRHLEDQALNKPDTPENNLMLPLDRTATIDSNVSGRNLK